MFVSVCVVVGGLLDSISNEHCLLSGEDQGNNKPIEPQHLSKNQDEDHAHKQTRLLGCASDSRVSHNSDGEASSEAAQTHTQSGTQVQETPAHEEKDHHYY